MMHGAQENEGTLIKSALDRARISARNMIDSDFQDIKTDLIQQVVAVNQEGFRKAVLKIQNEHSRELGSHTFQRPDFAEFQFTLITKAVDCLLVDTYGYLKFDVEEKGDSKNF